MVVGKPGEAPGADRVHCRAQGFSRVLLSWTATSRSSQAFDLNAVAVGVVPSHHTTTETQCLLEMRLPGHVPTLDANLDFTNAPESEVQLWKPWNCRHLGTSRENVCPLRELQTQL